MSEILVAAGGTGGHVYPALALAETLRGRGHHVWFVGGDRLERDVVPAAGFELEVLPARGFPTRPTLSAVVAGVALLRSLAGARKLLRSRRPDAVVGMGGYPSFAPSWTAGGIDIPVVLHEQNAVLTRSHRLASRRASVLALSLPVSEPLPARLRVCSVGNPIRAPLARTAGDEAARRSSRDRAVDRWNLDRDRLTLLVFGGSQGARPLNETLPRVSLRSGELQVIHIAGRGHERAVRDSWSGANVPVTVLGYLDAMEDAYSAADLVISRSGATTVAEIAAFGLPAILVPLPGSARGAQDANARVLERAGAARVTSQGADLVRTLGKEIRELVDDEARRKAMSEAARGLGAPDAAVKLADVVESELSLAG